MTLFPDLQRNNVPLIGNDVSVSTQTSPLITSPLSSTAYIESFHENEDASSSDVEMLIEEGEGAVRKKRRPKRGDDFEFKEALVKADFWLLWFAYSLGVGSQ